MGPEGRDGAGGVKAGYWDEVGVKVEAWGVHRGGVGRVAGLIEVSCH